MTLARYFDSELVPVSGHLGVLTPTGEVGCELIGVSDTLLSGAEDYFKKFKQYGYIYWVLAQAIENFENGLSGVAVDFGSGFGNTVIPLLEHHPDLSVLATDISPDLLAICGREARERGFGERCLTVAMDAQRDYFHTGFADAAFGCAVLHHMIDPALVVRTALKTLKPGGKAVFIEPFESGNAILRVAYTLILNEASRRGDSGPQYDFLRAMNEDIRARTQRFLPAGHPLPGWEHLDDKWVFTRAYFERIAEQVGARSVRIDTLHSTQAPFTHQTRMALQNYGGVDPDSLPPWAWEILRAFDEDFFSADQKQDLMIEAVVTFTR
jgi:SAM-dependent methyltransferase